MSVLNYRDKNAEDRVIYALTMEDVFNITDHLRDVIETSPLNIQRIRKTKGGDISENNTISRSRKMGT